MSLSLIKSSDSKKILSLEKERMPFSSNIISYKLLTREISGIYKLPKLKNNVGNNILLKKLRKHDGSHVLVPTISYALPIPIFAR